MNSLRFIIQGRISISFFFFGGGGGQRIRSPRQRGPALGSMLRSLHRGPNGEGVLGPGSVTDYVKFFLARGGVG